jgi:hypothetical protein
VNVNTTPIQVITKVNTNGPRTIPSVQSPRIGPRLWKKLAFHAGIVLEKIEMERREVRRVRKERMVLSLQRGSEALRVRRVLEGIIVNMGR